MWSADRDPFQASLTYCARNTCAHHRSQQLDELPAIHANKACRPCLAKVRGAEATLLYGQAPGSSNQYKLMEITRPPTSLHQCSPLFDDISGPSTAIYIYLCILLASSYNHTKARYGHSLKCSWPFHIHSCGEVHVPMSRKCAIFGVHLQPQYKVLAKLMVAWHTEAVPGLNVDERVNRFEAKHVHQALRTK